MFVQPVHRQSRFVHKALTEGAPIVARRAVAEAGMVEPETGIAEHCQCAGEDDVQPIGTDAMNQTGVEEDDTRTIGGLRRG